MVYVGEDAVDAIFVVSDLEVVFLNVEAWGLVWKLSS